MEIINLFPTELFVFRNTHIDNAELISKLEKLDNIEIKTSSTLSMLADLRNNSDFEELFSWFNNCLEEIRVSFKYDCEKIEITNSWFNVALGGYKMYQNHHRHSMSFYSAVYYATDGASTLFEDPVTQRNHAQIEVLRHDYTPMHISPAEAGKLIIFPSWLYHSSQQHLEDHNRYVISFNTLPTGKINHSLATDSKTEIIIK